MFHKIYALSLSTVVTISVIAFIIWTVCAMLFLRFNREKQFRIINIVLTAVSLVCIYIFGIHGRKTGDYELYLNPFYQFELGKTSPEMYRTMVMNVVMFLPFGMTLPFSFSMKKIYINVLISIAIGFSVSFCVESVQYILSIGRAESADVMCNTFGMVVGAIPYILSRIITNRKTRSAG